VAGGQVQPTARMQPMNLPKHTAFTSRRIHINMHGCKKAIDTQQRQKFHESILTSIQQKQKHAHGFKSQSPGSSN
jgi:hypothetical protein